MSQIYECQRHIRNLQLKATPWGLFSTIKQEFFFTQDISIISYRYTMISICNATENLSHCLMHG